MEQKTFVRYFVVALIVLVCASLNVSAITITTFNNSLGSENLTFTGTQSYFRYLSIPNTISRINSGQITLVTNSSLVSYVSIVNDIIFPSSSSRLLNSSNTQAYWSFEDGFGTYISDVTNHGNNGTLHNGTWVSGKNGTAVEYSGMPYSFSDYGVSQWATTFANNFTISVWIKMNQTSSVKNDDQCFLSKWWNGSVRSFQLCVKKASDTITLAHTNDDGSTTQVLDSGFSPVVGTWYHVVYTYRDNGNKTIYVNGVPQASVIFHQSAINSAPLIIGSDSYTPTGLGNTAPFNGTIDEVAIINRTLTAAEVTTLYSNNNLGLSYNSASETVTIQHYINKYLTPAYLVGSNYVIPFNFTGTSSYISYGNISVSNEGATENSQTYDSVTYATANTDFILNMSYDTGNYLIGSAVLDYNGTLYPATSIGTETNGVILTANIDMPSTDSAISNSFHWNVILVPLVGSSIEFNSTSQTQTIYPIALNWCGVANSGLPYINFTFKDEQTLAVLNASTDASSWTYYLGNGDTTESLSYQNSSLSPSWAFCFNPQNRSITSSYSYSFSSTGYAQRTHSQSLATLSNTTTNQVLYLLSSSSGVAQPIIVTNAMQIPIPGATVTVSALVGGVQTILGQSTTDSAGTVTFWLDSNKQHTVTVEVTGCSIFSGTLTPGVSPYTAIMGGCSGSISNVSYNFSTQGMKWKISPASGPLARFSGGFCSQTYNFNLTASMGNLVDCKLDILDTNGTVLSTVRGVTNSTSCELSLVYNAPDVYRLKGRASIRTTSSGGEYYVLDDDAYWFCLDTDSTSYGSLKHFFTDMRNLPEFGGNEIRQEYSRIVFFFLLITILVGIFTFFTGYELNNPGAAMGIFVPLMATAGLSGWFQMQLSAVKYEGSYVTFADTHLVWVLAVIMGLAFVANYYRKAS